MAMVKPLFDSQPSSSSSSSSKNNNGLNNQVNFYSQTLLLNSRIDFKSEKEFDNDSDDDFPSSVQKLKTKYHVLTGPVQSNSNVSQSKLSYSNGYNSPLKIKISAVQKSASVTGNGGNDDNELGQPKRILYPREKIVLEWKKISKIGAGLANVGNTCFMNSVLQCLTYCPPLVNYLCSIREEHPTKCRQNFCMICLMLKHISLVLHRDNSVIKPLYICQRLKSIAKHFTFGRQEDAHEFLRYVVDHMCRSCLSGHELENGIPGLVSKYDHLTKATTAINHIFGGYHRSQVQCLQCKGKSNTYDYFMDFMLDIQHVSSLEEALRNFVNPEILRNDNAYKCLKCKKSSTARKQFTVYRAPNVATFQLKRFDCSRMFGQSQKIVKMVTYPETLDLRPYMSENGPPLMYKLISVLVHQGGSCNSGHYYCYVRNSNNCWYNMDDSHVSQVSLNVVLNQKAYILFYIRNPNDPKEKCRLSSSQITVPAKTLSSTPKSDTCTSVNPSKIFNSNFKFTLNLKGEAHIVSHSSPSSKSLSTIREDSKQEIKTILPNIKSQQLTQQPTNSYNGLVPYGQENASDEETKKSEKQTLPTKNHHSVVPTSNKFLSKHENSGSKDSTFKEKNPIPILKVKATVNSWQVVEATNDTSSTSNSQQNSDRSERKYEYNSNWKISKASDRDSSASKSPSDRNRGSLNQFDKRKTQEDLSSRSSSSFHKKKHSSNKKDKKKKRKKDKGMKRKRNDDDLEVDWVERTKETLGFDGKSQASHQKPSVVPETSGESPNKKAKLSSGMSDTTGTTSKSDILDALLKNASNGYSGVKSWNGNVSNLHLASTQKSRSSSFENDDDERYDEEFDKGKTAKHRNKIDQFSLYKSHHGQNPFQIAQQSRYNYHNNHHHHHQNHFNGKKIKPKFHLKPPANHHQYQR